MYGPVNFNTDTLFEATTPGAPELVSKQRIGDIFRFTYRLPSRDSNTGPLTGLTRISGALRYTNAAGENPWSDNPTFEDLLTDAPDQVVDVDVTQAQGEAGELVDVDFNVAGHPTNYCVTAAACTDGE